MTGLSLEDLLAELRHRRWTLHIFGARDAPKAIAAVFRWETCADVLILRGEEDATAYRAPAFPETDLFAPTRVTWQYHSSAWWTLRAVLTLDPPGHPRTATALTRPAPQCAVPMEIRRPTILRYLP